MMDESKEVRQIPIEDIIPNRFQPRINFDEKALNELAESIKQHGIIQPLVLRPLGDKFEIIAGERRYKAATIAGLSTVPGIVTEMDDNTSAEVALIENVQRKDLSAIEEAKSYKSMLDRSNMTQEELAKKMGLSQSTIANKLRLLNLSDEVQNALSQEKISERHARALLSINDKEEQVKWLNRIINERLTVRQLDLAIKDELNNSDDNDTSDDIPKVNINPDIEGIINNAVDINTEMPNTNNSQENVDTFDISKPTNRFFNYIEDEEVNMNTSENNDVPSTNVENNDFNFTPEFQTVPENQPIQENIEDIDTLDVLETPVNEIQSNISLPNEPVINVDNSVDVVNSNEVSEVNNPQPLQEEASVIPENIEESVIESIEPQMENSVENSVTTENVNNSFNDIVSDNQNISSEPEEFIFDEDEDSENDEINNIGNQNKTVKVEPIPVVNEEGVVDPVAYYDTLDPNFMDRVKEYVGLDLKRAINSYRDLTNDLNSSGFNITIDETDLDNKYTIEINIKKE